MTRRMSVALTLDAVHARTKDVTRRAPETWATLKPGDVLTLIEKGMGLPRGARQIEVCDVRIVSNDVQPLGRANAEEVAREGFPGHDPVLWREWWAMAHHLAPVSKGSLAAYREAIDTIKCRRIEWSYDL